MLWLRSASLAEARWRSSGSLAMAERFEKVAFVASPTPEAQEACAALSKAYPHVDPESADVIVALGGDGLMLQTLHRFMGANKPIYGMNRGSVGFLMNEYQEEGLRESYQAAKLRIGIDGQERMAELIADGVLVSTPAGSTAYNLSANGPILPLNAPLLALTPISAFRPRRWHGALLPKEARIRIHVVEAERRPVIAVAD